MRLFFDQNLSHHLVDRLADVYPDALHVRMVGLKASDDAAVWEYAKAHQLIIVSKDSDFHQRSLLYGPPPKVVWIQRGNCPTADIEALLRQYRSDLEQFFRSMEGAFLVVS